MIKYKERKPTEEKAVNRENIGGAGSTLYEYTVTQKRTAAVVCKRVTLIACYTLWAAALFLAGLRFNLVVLAVELIPFTLWGIIALTWRLTKIKYEYSFFDGTLTVCRILGNSGRKVLCTIPLRKLSAAYPCEDEYIARIESLAPDRTVFAASDSNAQDLYAVLWTDEKDRKNLLYFEPDERALKIMRQYNITAVTLKR